MKRPEGRPGQEEEAHGRQAAESDLDFGVNAACPRRCARAAAAALEGRGAGPARAGPGGEAAVACRRARRVLPPDLRVTPRHSCGRLFLLEDVTVAARVEIAASGASWRGRAG